MEKMHTDISALSVKVSVSLRKSMKKDGHCIIIYYTSSY